MEEHSEINVLIAKDIWGHLTAEEQLKLDQWRLEAIENDEFFKEVSDPDNVDNALSAYIFTELNSETIEDELWENYQKIAHKILVLKRLRQLAVAASILLFISVGIYFLMPKDVSKSASTVQGGTQAMDATVAPGCKCATLMLADGRKIILDSTNTGELAQQSISIIYNDSNTLSYKVNPAGTINNEIHNTLTTAPGETYKVVLPDGSRVWLNAASSIRYPVVFTSSERKVEISGEAYFEVAPRKERPFKVVINNKVTVDVLGTHFNVNAYFDEPQIKTTLIEGKVRVNNGNYQQVITPGQQALISPLKDSIDVDATIDPEQTVAWKDGFFNFNNSSLRTIMRQISRWYNLPVQVAPDVPDERYGGKIYRDKKLSEVLKAFEPTGGVRFWMQGKTLMVTLN